MDDYSLIPHDVLGEMLDDCKDKIDMLKHYYKITEHDINSYSVMWKNDKPHGGGRTGRKRRRKKKRKTRKRRKTKRRKRRKRRSRKKKGGVYTEKGDENVKYKDRIVKLIKNDGKIAKNKEGDIGRGEFFLITSTFHDGRARKFVNLNITPDAILPTLKQFFFKDFDKIILLSPDPGAIGS